MRFGDLTLIQNSGQIRPHLIHQGFHFIRKGRDDQTNVPVGVGGTFAVLPFQRNKFSFVFTDDFVDLLNLVAF